MWPMEMTPTRKRLLTGIATALTATALIGGAVALRPGDESLALAQTASTTTTSASSVSTSTTSGQPGRPGWKRGSGGPLKGVLDSLVSAGTITPAQETAIQRGLVSYWQAHRPQPGQGHPSVGPGGALKDVLDGLVANNTITAAQETAIQQKVQAQFQQWRQQARAGMQAVRQAVASALGLTPDQLQQQRQAGKSLSAIAQAQGKTDQQLKDAITAAVQAQLNARVSSGAITQQQASNFLQRFTSHLDQIIHATPHHRRTGGATTSTSTTSTSTTSIATTSSRAS